MLFCLVISDSFSKLGLKMKFIVILSILLHVHGEVIKEQKEKCEGVVLNDVYHEIEVLKELDRPFLLAVEYVTNTLYFSYSVNPEDGELKSACLNLNTMTFKDIEGVKDGFAQAIDPKTHEVYIGGSDGIYKYDFNNDKAEIYAAKGEDIWYLFYKDVLYYSGYPSQFLYIYSNGESKRYKDLEDTKVDQFIIDKSDVIFYTNDTGLLYSQKKGTKDAVLVKGTESKNVRALTLDTNDNIYVCVSDGIYTVDKAEMELERVLEIENAFGLAFDNNNNIIYADADHLIRLKPNKNKSC